ncbi:MAG: hypothetical protein WAL27_04580 [Cellulosimicrobium cellulans]
MTHIQSVTLIARSTFGRDGAMFEGLLGFVSQLSVGLWGLVILTVVMRCVGVWMYRRGAARSARAATVALSCAVLATAEKDSVRVPAELAGGGLVHVQTTTDAVTNATFDHVRQPATFTAAVAVSVKVARRAFRRWRTEPHSAAHVPTLAANSTEA